MKPRYRLFYYNDHTIFVCELKIYKSHLEIPKNITRQELHSPVWCYNCFLFNQK